MTRLRWLLAGSFLVGSSLFLAQASKGRPTGPPGPPIRVLQPEVSVALLADVSPPLRDIVPIPPAAGDTIREIEVENTELGKGKLPKGSTPAPFLTDRVVQSKSGGPRIPPTEQNFDGIPNVNGVLPPDTNGDIGPNHYVQWVNLSFAIYSRTGTLLFGPANGNTIWQGLPGPCSARNDGDPIVLYDHLADRWFFSQLAAPGGPSGFHQCIAVSQTPDPMGPYFRYDFLYSPNTLNDYPHFGVWPDAYYMSVNQFFGATGAGAVAFERDKILIGDPGARMVKFDLSSVNPNFGGMLPSDLDGPPPPAGAPNYFMEVDKREWIPGSPFDALRIWQFHVDWTNPANSTFGIAGQPNALLEVATFNSLCVTPFTRNCIPQPGTAQRLDAIGDRLMYRIQYRNFGDRETLVTNHTVDAGPPGNPRAGVRWYELRNPNNPVIFQQGTYAPDDGIHRWMGSAAMDSSGDIALGFSVSNGSSTFPSVRYTGRLASDPPGTMPQGEGTIINGTGSQTHPAARWGDYSMLAVDPTDNCTFWYTNEYLQVTGVAPWRTRVGSFKFPSCGAPIAATPTSAKVCRPGSATSTISVFGGPGKFQADVTLSLASVSPPEPSIGATFSPNPVPAPPPTGSDSTMTVSTDPATPAGTYVLTIQGTDGTLTATVNFTLTVVTDPPAAPNLLTPPDGADGVSTTPTFTWTAASGADSYRLQVFAGDGCAGTPIRDISGITTTSFTLPAVQALDFFTRYSWKVFGVNACGETVSAACFNFRTLSCSPSREFAINGGFEQDFTGWVIDQTNPPPTISTVNPHSGLKSAQLGTFSGPEPLGDSSIYQQLVIPPGAVNASLVFWFWPFSTDTVAFDQQYVRIIQVDPPGPTVELMREANNSQQWLRRQFSLAPFTGRTIRILFGVHQDGFGDPTAMRVDDVSVTWQSCGPPDFRVTIVSPAIDEVCAGGQINYTVGVESLHGPNFMSPVELSAQNLPPNTFATFAANPIRPGETTTLTLQTSPPIISARYNFQVVGRALEPPPAEPRSTNASVLIVSKPPDAVELVSPPNGEVNVSIRPTLMWNEPFVELPQPSLPTGDSNTLTNLPPGTPNPNPNLFGARSYHVQVALDADFTRIVFQADTSSTNITLPFDLTAATPYYWRVNGTNACGTGPYSPAWSFVTGACFSGFTTVAPYPQPAGILWMAATSAGGKIYSFGGSNTLASPIPAITNSYSYDPGSNTWTPIASLPAPRLLMNAAEVGGKIYIAGGGTSALFADGTNTMFEYTVATNTWATKAPMAIRRVGAAMAAVGGKVYIFGGFADGTATPTNSVVEYDPAANTHTAKAGMPTARGRAHAAVIGGKIYVIGGQGPGVTQRENQVFDPATNTWQTKAQTLWPVGFDMGTTVLAGKIYVFGRDPSNGTPEATQSYDPTTDAWTAFTPLIRAANNNQAVTLGFSMYIVGGFDGNTRGIHNVVQRFRSCEGSSHIIPFVVDGDGSVPGISNEKTALLLNNGLSGSTSSATVFFYLPDGSLDSSRIFSLAPNELKTVTDVIRQVRGVPAVQNVEGSLAIFGSDPIDVMASIVHNTTNDPASESPRTFAGVRNGMVPLIQLGNYQTQTVWTNTSSGTANVQLLAYSPTGGDTPVASASVSVPPHGLLDYHDTVSQLGLAAGHFGQLSWNSTQPIAVFTRQMTVAEGYSGDQPVHDRTDGSGTAMLAYVEDTDRYSSHLELNNTGLFTSNVTVRFVDISDPTGATPGASSARDIPVPINSATVLSDVIRWVLRDPSGAPSGKRGFLVITTPQTVLASAHIIQSSSSDPNVPDQTVAAGRSTTPLILRIEPFSPGSALASSRLAISNPGSGTAHVQLTAFNSSGSVAGTLNVNVVGSGEFFTEDIVGAMGLSPIFQGWLTVSSDVGVLVYNQRQSGEAGAVVPVFPH